MAGGSGTPSRRVARNAALFPEEETEITSSYRATYGGPAGLAASSWTSRSTTSPTSTPNMSRQQSISQHNSFSATSGAGGGKVGAGVGDSVNNSMAESGLRSPISRGVSSSSIRLDMERLDIQKGGSHRVDSGEVVGVVGASPPGSRQNDFNITPSSPDHLVRAEAALAAARQQLAASSGALPPLAKNSSPSLPKPDEENSDLLLANTEGISPSKLPFAPPNGNNNATPLTAAAMDAAHRVAGLVSILTTGRPSEQIKAAVDLHTILVKHGEPVQRATHLAGGTHMLSTVLQSKQKQSQPELQNACAAGLAEVCKHPPALEELVALQDGPSIIIAACLKGIAAGSEVYAHLFITLVSNVNKESNDAVKAACAGHKAVRVLANILAGDENSNEKNSDTTTIVENNYNNNAQKLALAALEALCIADPGPNLRKLAWGGGLASLVPLIQPPFDHSAASAMHLLLLALDQDKRHAESLCSPSSLIEELSILIADSDVDLTLQVGATKVLAAIAALRSRKDDATQALNDCALPRACEILHQAEALWSEGAPSEDINADLQAACAALVAHLSVGSPLCCHVVLFHAEALRTVVSVLSGRHEFGLVEAVLGATANYAAAPTVAL
jgi:hypothetical protein